MCSLSLSLWWATLTIALVCWGLARLAALLAHFHPFLNHALNPNKRRSPSEF
jgi:hypothetical protein